MNSEGEMLWERYYYTDSINYFDQFGNDYISGGQFFDVEELENGDLVVVGEKHIRKQEEDGSWIKEEDLWLLRLNSDGCIGDYCGEDSKTTITSTNEEELEQEAFTIYPNPASTEITISTANDKEVSIYTINGAKLKSLKLSNGENIIDISDLVPGIYVLRSFSSKLNSIISNTIVKL